MEASQSETLNPTDSLRFPFLGSLETGEVFEYLLLSIDIEFAEIAIFQWFVNRIQLHIGEKTDLYLPYLLSTEYKLRGNISGHVVAAKHMEEIQGEIYQVSLSKQETNSFAHYYSLEQFTKQLPTTLSLMDLLRHLIRDSMLVKAGIGVYLKHLIPYFSRITNYSYHEYNKLKTYFLHDVAMHITRKEAKLEKLYEIAKQKISKTEEIPIYIDLEDLRETLESEISLSVFNVVFSMEKEFGANELFLTDHPQSGVLMYIHAIKSLEKRLYSNYNHIVIIYLKSLQY